jgi:hypothetical protein
MCLPSRYPVIERVRACWVTQAESGRLVAPARWTSCSARLVRRDLLGGLIHEYEIAA